MNKLMKSLLLATLGSVLILNFSYAKEYSISDVPVLQQDTVHETVARRVTHFFTQSHYRDFDLDDEFSVKVFDRYLKQLDYSKLFFTEADVARFDNKKTLLAGELKTGELKTAFELYNFSLKKRFERYQYALALLEKPMNFDSEEMLDLDRKNASWPISESELDTQWQARVKSDALSLSLTGKNETEIKEILSKRYNRVLKMLVQSNSEDAFQTFMNAFAREVDPHTSYLAPRKKRDFETEMNLSFEGIGATLSMEEEYATIMSFVTGGPAEKTSQLAIGDRIIGVGQKDGAIEDVIGWRLDDIVDRIRGPKGTPVRLEILPVGATAKPKIIEIIRDTVRFEDRQAKLSIVENERGNVGVIEIPSFYMGLTERVKELLSELQGANVNSLVIDLRSNGGGSLAEVIALTGLFIEQGPVVQVRDSLQKITPYEDEDGIIYYTGPMTVLVNRYSASASEIFAAALQDYGRALIVGETTFGKGTVQTSRSIAYPIDARLHPDWPTLGGVQYTIQKFYRINGGSTQLKGVEPDITLTSKFDSETGERFMDNALPWDSIQAAKYDSVGNIDKLLSELTLLHAVRIENNPEFQYVEEDIQRYNQEKAQRYVISLNKAQRQALQDEEEQRQLIRMNGRLSLAGLEPIANLEQLPKDYKLPDAFLDETIEISLDLAARYPEITGKTLAQAIEEQLESSGQIIRFSEPVK